MEIRKYTGEEMSGIFYHVLAAAYIAARHELEILTSTEFRCLQQGHNYCNKQGLYPLRKPDDVHLKQRTPATNRGRRGLCWIESDLE